MQLAPEEGAVLAVSEWGRLLLYSTQRGGVHALDHRAGSDAWVLPATARQVGVPAVFAVSCDLQEHVCVRRYRGPCPHRSDPLMVALESGRVWLESQNRRTSNLQPDPSPRVLRPGLLLSQGLLEHVATDPLGANWLVTASSRGHLTLWDMRFRVPLSFPPAARRGPVIGEAGTRRRAGAGAGIGHAAGADCTDGGEQPPPSSPLVYVAAGPHEVSLWDIRAMAMPPGMALTLRKDDHRQLSV